MMLISMVVVVLAAVGSSLADDVKARLSVVDNWLVDQYGRVRIFHGINSVVKGCPYYDDQILNVTRLKMYRQWGFNAVRLGAMWTGAQPVRQRQFNETYISVLENVVKQLAVYAIHVLLDMHQVTYLISFIYCVSYILISFTGFVT